MDIPASGVTCKAVYTHVHTPHALSTLFSDEHLDCVLVSAPSLSCVYDGRAHMWAHVNIVRHSTMFTSSHYQHCHRSLCHHLPFKRCFMSSAISLAQLDVLSAWYTVPVSRSLRTAPMISLARDGLNLCANAGSWRSSSCCAAHAWATPLYANTRHPTLTCSCTQAQPESRQRLPWRSGVLAHAQPWVSLHLDLKKQLFRAAVPQCVAI